MSPGAVHASEGGPDAYLLGPSRSLRLRLTLGCMAR